MPDHEDYIIQKQYNPTEDEAACIQTFQSHGLNASDWDSTKEGIVSFKSNAREHLYCQQHFRCAYCRMEIPYVSNRPLDHIVPKSTYPMWLFEPRNLCVCCDRCNSYKKDKDVLATQEIDGYPNRSEDFNIVNPYIDRYFEHITIEGGIIYRGKSSKGRFTITTCGLSRMDYVMDRSREKMSREDPDSIMTLVLSLLDKTHENELDKARARLEKIVQVYKSQL